MAVSLVGAKPPMNITRLLIYLVLDKVSSDHTHYPFGECHFRQILSLRLRRTRLEVKGIVETAEALFVQAASKQDIALTLQESR
jgi:hypothetical protein